MPNSKQLKWRDMLDLFCLSWTLSFGDVLEFSTTAKDDFDAEEKVFDA